MHYHIESIATKSRPWWYVVTTQSNDYMLPTPILQERVNTKVCFILLNANVEITFILQREPGPVQKAVSPLGKAIGTFGKATFYPVVFNQENAMVKIFTQRETIPVEREERSLAMIGLLGGHGYTKANGLVTHYIIIQISTNFVKGRDTSLNSDALKQLRENADKIYAESHQMELECVCLSCVVVLEAKLSPAQKQIGGELCLLP